MRSVQRHRRLRTALLALALAAGSGAAEAQCELESSPEADSVAEGQFGYAVAVFENRALVSASRKPQGSGSFEGVVSVYRYASPGSWDLEETWLSPEPVSPWFGEALATHEQTAAVGAPWGTETSPAGAVYLYHFEEGTWTFEDTLHAPGAPATDGFGFAVAVSGDTLVVGAPSGAGAVHVFKNSGAGWTHSAQLASPGGETGFGADVAIDGTTLVVGDKWGRAHVYENVGSYWLHQHSTDTLAGFDLGNSSVDVDGDTVAVGGRGLWSSPAHVLVLERLGDQWETVALLEQPAGVGTAEEDFGAALSLSGTHLAIGNRYSDDTGEVFVYERDEAAWVFDTTWRPVEPAVGALLGASLDLSNDRLVAGAPGTSFDGIGSAAGSASFWSVDGSSCPTLSGLPTSLSTSHGGSHSIWINAGEKRAGAKYLVVGGFTGTTPGIELPELTLPLNLDAWTLFTISQPNTPPYSNSLGVLDGKGSALTTFQLPAGLSPGLAGIAFDHVVVTLDVEDGIPTTTLLGGPTSVTLVP